MTWTLNVVTLIPRRNSKIRRNPQSSHLFHNNCRCFKSVKLLTTHLIQFSNFKPFLKVRPVLYNKAKDLIVIVDLCKFGKLN